MSLRADEALELAAGARELLRSHDGETIAIWPRAVALAGRQSLEASMDALWALRAPGLEEAPARCQLLCLRYFLGEGRMARDSAIAWSSLSRACHFVSADLGPTHEELDGWLAVAWELANRVVLLEMGGS